MYLNKTEVPIYLLIIKDNKSLLKRFKYDSYSICDNKHTDTYIVDGVSINNIKLTFTINDSMCENISLAIKLFIDDMVSYNRIVKIRYMNMNINKLIHIIDDLLNYFDDEYKIYLRGVKIEKLLGN